jgi:hypothetical protein
MFKILPAFITGGDRYIMGGTLCEEEDDEVFANAAKEYIKPDDNYVERFLRPSSQEPLEKKYFIDEGQEKYTKNFSMPGYGESIF